MPYKKNEIPTAVKNLPKGAQSSYKSTFNAVLKSGGSEDEARKAAWRNVKLKYKKVGDKWVAKTTAGEFVEVPAEELEGIDINAEIKEMEEIEPEEISIQAALRISESNPFIEFKEEEGKKKAIYRVIKAGWSGNGFYYSPDVVKQLVPFIEKKPMFFADHIEPSQKKNMIFGQKLRDAVAMAEQVWATGDGQVLAKLSPIGNPATEWIWEAAQKHPEHIGNSIDAYGKVKKGEAEGKKGNIVEGFVGYDSTDFVYRPSAGGKFMQMTEAHQLNRTDSDSTTINFTQSDVINDYGSGTDYTPYTFTLGDEKWALEEAAKTLKDVMKKHQQRSLFWNIGYILTDFIYAVSVDRNMSEDDKKKSVEQAVKDFTDSLRDIDPVTLFNESLIEGETIKPIDKLKYKLEDSMEIKEMIEALKNATPAQILESNPDLYNAIVKASVENKEIQESLKKVPTLEKDNQELRDSVTSLTQEKEKAEKELKEAKEELQKYKDAEEKATWFKRVDELIKESKIDNALVTETFKGQLLESKDEDKVKTLLDDRKGLKSGPEFDNGKPGENTQETIKSKIPSDDELARDIKASR